MNDVDDYYKYAIEDKHKKDKIIDSIFPIDKYTEGDGEDKRAVVVLKVINSRGVWAALEGEATHEDSIGCSDGVLIKIAEARALLKAVDAIREATNSPECLLLQETKHKK